MKEVYLLAGRRMYRGTFYQIAVYADKEKAEIQRKKFRNGDYRCFEEVGKDFARGEIDYFEIYPVDMID